MPERIQRKRTKGHRHPEGTLFVTRPGPLSNPYRIIADDNRIGWFIVTDGGLFPRSASSMTVARLVAVALYRDRVLPTLSPEQLERVRNARYVACYCDPSDGMACHVDVLIAAVSGD